MVMTEVTEQTTQLAGVNVMLMGPAGSGKTHSIGTLVEAGVEVFYLDMENGLEALLGYWKDRGLEVPANLHWHKMAAPTAGFAELLDSAKKINTLSLDALAKMADPNRGKHNQFVTLLETLNNFPDDRTGEKFGDVSKWGPGRALAIDGMTGIGKAAMSLVVGGKPVKNQSDWGIAQDQVEKVIRMLCDSCPCHFILIAHIERETDQILGGIKLMVATLGRALAPKIPPMFSDVVLAVRNADKWFWDTASAQADVKTRNLPLNANNPPDFRAIIAKWQARGGRLDAKGD